MSDAATATYRWAWALIDALAAAGLRRLVMSPGSRSTPLTLAALRHPQLDVQVSVDERAAGFLALGLAKAEGRPVALVATSGSAVANWLPAVVEADMGRVPLILLSADRPPELHDCGANQTMDQIGLFGRHVRAFHQLPPAEDDSRWLTGLAARSLAASLGPLPGPVHWNVPLREPLVPTEVPALAPSAAVPRALPSRLLPEPAALDTLAPLFASGPGAIVCGPEDLGAEARAALVDAATRLRVPLLADLLSGLRCGAADGGVVLAHPDPVARSAPAVRWLLRFGGAPVSRALNDWLARCAGAAQVVVSAHPRVADPAGLASHVLHADPAALCRSLPAAATADDSLAVFHTLDAAARAAAEATCADAAPFEGGLLRAVLHALPADTAVFIGNSLAIRAADSFAGCPRAPLRLFGNRGVSGIDGNLATACGIATALGPTLAVVGDLTFLHDLNSLALARTCPLSVLLLDNGGGGIFDHLAQAALPEFERGWLTPQPFDAAAAARTFGLAYQSVAHTGDAVTAVQAMLAGTGGIVHVSIDRAHSLARTRHFQSLARTPTA